MSTFARPVRALITTLPLVVGLASPAVAGEPVRYSESSTHVEATGVLVGILDGIPGNVHTVRVAGDQGEGDVYAYGELQNWSCPDGVTDPRPDAGQEPACTSVGLAYLEGFDVTVTVARTLASGSLRGTVETTLKTCDDVECSLEDGPDLAVDVTVTAGDAQAVTSRSVSIIRDPATGYKYRGQVVRSTRSGSAAGTVGGLALEHGEGYVGTYSFRAMEKL